MTHHASPLLDGSGYGAPVAGRLTLALEVLTELRRSVRDEELGATLRVRLPGGRVVLCTGADVPQRQVGATLHVSGYWAAHPARGTVFRVEDVHRIERPQATAAVARYLVANIPGLGPARARRIATVLGADALERLTADPGLVRTVLPGGTGEQVALALTAWAAEQARDSVAQRLTQQLTAAGVRYGTVRRIVRFFSTTDAAAVATLRRPYRLLDVPGIGWATADGIAQRLGVPVDDPERFLAACTLTLHEAPARGHTALPSEALRTSAARLLECGRDDARLLAASARLSPEGYAVGVDGKLGLPDAVALEAEVADHIAGLMAIPRSLDARARAIVRDVLGASKLADEQRDAVWMALAHGCSVLTGRPGAGKTTTLKSLVACAQALGWGVQIVAPTGKAASRAAAVTGVAASTVHRLLAREPVDAPAPLAVDLVVVDEASMCDLETAAWLLRAINPQRTRCVWCGDADQLPSVGAGQVLADLLASGVVPAARMTTVFRQVAASRIVQNAHRLLDRVPLVLGDTSDWSFTPVTAALAKADAHVLEAVQVRLAAGDAPDDVQVLAPMRRGPLGVEHLNCVLQDLLNPTGAVGPYVGGGVRVRIGDRVVATRNIYDLPTPLYNGEQGVVKEVDRRGIIRIRVDDRTLTLTGVHCLMVRLAWAMTVHRSQGSEYPTVVLAYHDRAHAPMLDWRVLYTAITRARQHCSLVGSRAALEQTLARASKSVRHTTLAWQLATLLPHVSEAG